MAQIAASRWFLPLAGFVGAATCSAGTAALLMGGSSPLSFNAIMGLTAQADAAAAGALSPNEFRPFKLIKKEKLTGNTSLFRFELPDNQVSGLFTASCLVTKVMMKEKHDDEVPKPIIRPYTPTSPPGTKGHLDLVIKVYPTGKMGPHIDSLKIGDTLEMKGPIPKYPYQPNIKKHIGMVAGGTGIAPMLQVIDAVLSNPEDKTQLSLVYANVSEADIILKSTIDALAAAHPQQLKVYYIVDKANWGGMMWKGGVGYVSKDALKQHMPPPTKDNIVMVCGPPGMMAAVSGGKAPDYTQGEVAGLLKDLGYNKDQVYKF